MDKTTLAGAVLIFAAIVGVGWQPALDLGRSIAAPPAVSYPDPSPTGYGELGKAPRPAGSQQQVPVFVGPPQPGRVPPRWEQDRRTEPARAPSPGRTRPPATKPPRPPTDPPVEPTKPAPPVTIPPAPPTTTDPPPPAQPEPPPPPEPEPPLREKPPAADPPVAPTHQPTEPASEPSPHKPAGGDVTTFG